MIVRIAESHVPLVRKMHSMLRHLGETETVCASCGHAWPCEVRLLLSEVDSLAERVEQITPFIAEAYRGRAEIDRLKAEVEKAGQVRNLLLDERDLIKAEVERLEGDLAQQIRRLGEQAGERIELTQRAEKAEAELEALKRHPDLGGVPKADLCKALDEYEAQTQGLEAELAAEREEHAAAQLRLHDFAKEKLAAERERAEKLNYFCPACGDVLPKHTSDCSAVSEQPDLPLGHEFVPHPLDTDFWRCVQHGICDGQGEGGQLRCHYKGCGQPESAHRNRKLPIHAYPERFVHRRKP